MSDSRFNTGDVVRLKSGGPWMTVGGGAPPGGVHCQWFEGTSLMQGNFRAEQLEPKPNDDENFGFA